MEKIKLIETRKRKGLSQNQIAEKLHIDVSNYNRREKGNAQISYDEWEKLAQILDTPLEDIYESDEKHFVIFKDNAIGNYNGTNNVYSVPEHLLETQRKYIDKLEKELEELKKQL